MKHSILVSFDSLGRNHVLHVDIKGIKKSIEQGSCARARTTQSKFWTLLLLAYYGNSERGGREGNDRFDACLK